MEAAPPNAIPDTSLKILLARVGLDPDVHTRLDLCCFSLFFHLHFSRLYSHLEAWCANRALACSADAIENHVLVRNYLKIDAVIII